MEEEIALPLLLLLLMLLSLLSLLLSILISIYWMDSRNLARIYHLGRHCRLLIRFHEIVEDLVSIAGGLLFVRHNSL